jgi:general L-amino acid transport system permease protein
LAAGPAFAAGLPVLARLNAVLYDRKSRDILLQILLVVLLLATLWFFVGNVRDNLARSGIQSGFGFLGVTSGVDVQMHLIDYSASATYGRMLVVGILNTLLVSVLGIAIASVLGFAIGIARLSNNWILSTLCGAFIEFVRNIPLLLFVFFWYFGIIRALPSPRASLSVIDGLYLNNRGFYVPWPETLTPFLSAPMALAVAVLVMLVLRRWSAMRQETTGGALPWLEIGVVLIIGLPLLALVGAGLSVSWDIPKLSAFNFRGGVVLIPEFVALLAALSTYTAGFIAEIVRGGILSVSDGQRQAAQALGLTRWQVLRLVVLPQAMRVIVPPLTSQYLNLIKNSSFGAAIAYPEIVKVFVGSTLNQTGQAVEIIAMTLAIYLTINLATSAFMNWYNKRVALVTR